MGLREEVKIILSLEGAAATEKGVERVSNKLAATSRTLQINLRGIGAIGHTLGRTVFPEFNSVAGRSIAILGDMSAASLAAGIPLAGVGLGMAAVTAAVAMGASEWRKYSAAQKMAEDSGKALISQQFDLTIALERRIEFLKRSGQIDAGQADAFLLKLRQGGKESASAMAKEFRGWNPQATNDPRGGGAIALERELRSELLVGLDAELNKIEEVHDARLKIIQTMAESSGLAGKEIDAMVRLNDEVTTKQMVEAVMTDEARQQLEAAKLAAEQAKLDTQEAKDKLAVLEEITKEQEKAADDARRQAEERQQNAVQTAGYGAGLSRDIAGLTGDDVGEEAIRYQDQIAEINALRFESEEDYYAMVEQAAQVHSLRMVTIAKTTADREREILEKKLGAISSILGSGADLAKMYGKEGFFIAKALSLTQATINTALAVTNELGQGDIYSKPFRVAAVAALGAVQIASIAAQQPGYGEGGYTGDMAPNMAAGVVHGREFVFSAPATAAIGRGNLEAMHDSAASGGGGRGVTVQSVILDDRRKWEQMRNNPEAAQWFIDMSREHGWRTR